MKVEVIESFCGIEVGKQKTIPDHIAKNLITRNLVKEVDGKDDKLNADEAIEKINSFTTVEEVEAFMVGEKRKGVTSVAEAKIKALTTTE